MSSLTIIISNYFNTKATNSSDQMIEEITFSSRKKDKVIELIALCYFFHTSNGLS